MVGDEKKTGVCPASMHMHTSGKTETVNKQLRFILRRHNINQIDLVKLMWRVAGVLCIAGYEANDRILPDQLYW